MQSTSLHPAAPAKEPPAPAREAARLEALLAARRAELGALQESLRDFKARYADAVGGRLAELAELERAIRAAEARTLGVDHEDVAADAAADATHASVAIKASLKNLFWSVAKLFHPDHAADGDEARRRHSIMAEASRAYREGDVDSLNTLLADEDLQLYCATPRAADEGEGDGGAVDLNARILGLKEELLTIEFGIKRARQDRLYHLKLEADEAAAAGRDRLAEEAQRLDRKLVKTRNRLAHLS
ncbi:MAG TPA: hypothetical protein VM864_09170 [Pyrinomonadaceae bacterium]|jgi:hypothetical protein|nr:hypothetical protein [Pyrinomonadaceae bacterium]